MVLTADLDSGYGVVVDSREPGLHLFERSESVYDALGANAEGSFRSHHTSLDVRLAGHVRGSTHS